jgi:hypothetical protein
VTSDPSSEKAKALTAYRPTSGRKSIIAGAEKALDVHEVIFPCTTPL